MRLAELPTPFRLSRPPKPWRRRLLLGALLPWLGLAGVGAAEAQTRQFLTYLSRHQADVAVVSYTADAQGGVTPDASVLMHNPDLAMPLASTFKIVVLAAYGREVAAGRLDATAAVRVSDWERYYLPGTDGGAHPGALQELGIPIDELGFARDPTRTVPVDALAHAMIRWSDNAATDWLRVRVTPEVIDQVIAATGVASAERPVSLLGLFLLGGNHVDGALTWDRLRALLPLRGAAIADRAERYAALYQDPAWRAAEIAWLLRPGGGGYPLAARAFQAFFPRGSARDYASLIARAAAGTLLGQDASAVMLRHLTVPIAGTAAADVFSRVLEKGGDAEGVLTDAMVFVPRVGPFAGRTRVVVIFLQRIPEGPWNRFVEHLPEQAVAAAMALDPAAVEAVRALLR